MKEKAIENQILSWLAMHRILAFKHESQGTFDARIGVYRRKNSVHRKLGVADILGCIGGRFLAIEVKSQTGRLSDHQKQFLLEVLAHGGIAFMARSIEDVEENLTKAGVWPRLRSSSQI